ncbi:MAG: tyrosine recombinase XerC [Bacteroidaceae bacterium]|nr:tyrosine recombinase XerC [Bacteroidaceae bacterium]
MLVTSFLEYLRLERNYSEQTVQGYYADLTKFGSFVKNSAEGVSWEKVDTDIIRNWVVSLMDEGEKPTSVNRRLSAVRSFYRYLLKRGVIGVNPASKVLGPKKPKRLPMFVRESEVDKLLDDVSFEQNYKGHRDKLIIMILYMTGLRASELAGLNVSDIDFSSSQLKVLGKRNKQRIVPFDRELEVAIKDFLRLRESFCGDSNPALLLNNRGGRMLRTSITNVVKKWLSAVSTSEKRSAHVLRHTFATSMLNHDADLESIRQLLGHESLATTEIYTHTTFEELKKIYKNAHPRA